MLPDTFGQEADPPEWEGLGPELPKISVISRKISKILLQICHSSGTQLGTHFLQDKEIPAISCRFTRSMPFDRRPQTQGRPGPRSWKSDTSGRINGVIGSRLGSWPPPPSRFGGTGVGEDGLRGSNYLVRRLKLWGMYLQPTLFVEHGT